MRTRTVLAILLFLLLSWLTPAKAHAILVRSDPADNSILAESPEEIRMWFNETIVVKFSSVEIQDQNGNPVQDPVIQGDENDLTLMIVSLPKLGQGIYTVYWNTYSASDGHVARGFIVFGVGDTAGLSASQQDDVSANPGKNLAEIALRWLNYLGTILIVGCFGSLIILCWIKPAETSRHAEVELLIQKNRLRIYALGLLASGVSLLVGIAQLAWQIFSSGGSASGDVTLLETSKYILMNTQWGHAFIARQCLLVILLVLFAGLFRSMNPGKPVFIVGMVLAVCIQTTVSFVSHAASVENAPISIMVNTIHLVFVGLWVGTLLVLVYALIVPVLTKKVLITDLLVVFWRPFGVLAAVSVGMVIATGIYSTGVEVASLDGLMLSQYGRVLLVKILLVVLVGLVGFTNSMLLHPVLAIPLAKLFHKPAGWTPFRIEQFPRLVLVEGILGLLVILSVGILTTVPPARGPEYLIPPDAQQDDEFQLVDDLTVILSIRPNRPGQNLFDVKVMDSRRPPPAETLKVILRSTYLEQDIGTQSYDLEFLEDDGWVNTYRLVGNYLVQPGRWQFEVVVRRKGIPDSKAIFHWTVLPSGNLRPTVFSRAAWQHSLVSIAAVIAGMVLVLAILSSLREERFSFGKRKKKSL